jgi:hypothetical protein
VPPGLGHQLDKILTFIRNGYVTVQIIPFSAGAYAAIDAYFVLLEFGDESDLWPIVFVEGQTGIQYFKRQSDITRYHETINYLRERALDPDGSTDLIEKVRESYIKQ